VLTVNQRRSVNSSMLASPPDLAGGFDGRFHVGRPGPARGREDLARGLVPHVQGAAARGLAELAVGEDGLVPLLCFQTRSHAAVLRIHWAAFWQALSRFLAQRT
jgi:hypothetical protein